MTTRFVLLRHDVPPEFPRPGHWDLLLERDDVCWTWSLEVLPGKLACGEGPQVVDALRLKDHRQHYLQYEGPVSGDRGSVSRTLGGECEWLEVANDRLRVQLKVASEVLPLLLERIAGEQWRLTVL